VPSKFKASDGREFDTKKEAERHEAVITAVKEYEDAKHRLGRCLAEREKTADGQPFDFAHWGDYFYVTPGYGGMPGLSRVSFYVWTCTFDVDGLERVTIRQHRQVGPPYQDRVEEYRIRDLYADERAARRALLKAQGEWLTERAKEVAELKAELEK
jgi:hypothetical protein